MSGSSGSGAAYPYSSKPAGRQSRKVTAPSVPRLDTHAEPLSCCPPQTRYGKALSAVAWNICAVGWLYQELHVAPPLTLTMAPWSLASKMTSGFVGSIFTSAESSARSQRRSSAETSDQLSPASSER